MALKTTRKAGFVYKPRSEEKMKERANRDGAAFDSIYKPGFKTYKPKNGDNCGRVLPPTWDDAEHYAYQIWQHFGVGVKNSSYLCPKKMLGKPCCVCSEVDILKKAGEKDEAKQLEAKERYVIWWLNRDGETPDEPELWNMSWTQDRDIAAQCVHPRTGAILMIDEPDTGYDLMFKRKSTGKEVTQVEYYGYQVDRNDSPIHENQKIQDKILDYIEQNPIPEVLNIYDNDYLKNIMAGNVAEEDSEAQEEDEVPFEGGSRRASSRTTSRVRNEAPEEQEEVLPPRTSKRAPAVQEDEEVNEEEENNDPPPTASRRATNGRTRVVQEEPEDPAEEEEAVPRPSRRSAGRR